ncbi:NAD(P)/FAD-dependent oxidoreductase [Streptomyces coacervatus]|uniref:NAD(P)/FAD-dependent oxidoreductase n=1 Tax=Streptomyces coacervatus TaxID=647381 RepID=A0ABP7H7X8_9ACTN|nr:NAD(P)/FAD-dependent oxidoreductase [Streptomyces coacervatus]MDF2267453.1 NAD(P)/FAD-dependent oxidoreductase [Streptomyces coacervatus]
MYDVIVVGARCAGAPTAMLFARAGYRVLMVDKARFPRDTMSTLYIHQPGVAHLQRWGLLEAVAATGCPPMDRHGYQVADVRLEGCSWPVDGIRAAYAPRRHLLDPILAEAAVAAGAEFREQCTVDDLLFEGGRVVGVGLRTAAGRSEERARLVVGADGMRSRTAALAGAPTVFEDPLMTCAYYTFWSGLPTGFEVYQSTDRWVGFVPTNDGLTLVGTYFPQSEFDTVRANVRRAYLGNVAAVAPGLEERLASASQEERLYGTGEQRNFFRQASGPGWALVGDAAHHKDSITGKGITDAFRQATALTECVGDGLQDRPLLDAALDRYAREHQDLLMDGYRDTVATAELKPLRRLGLLRAIADDPVMTERFFSTVSGACPSSELITPEWRERARV